MASPPPARRRALSQAGPYSRIGNAALDRILAAPGLSLKGDRLRRKALRRALRTLVDTTISQATGFKNLSKAEVEEIVESYHALRKAMTIHPHVIQQPPPLSESWIQGMEQWVREAPTTFIAHRRPEWLHRFLYPKLQGFGLVAFGPKTFKFHHAMKLAATFHDEMHHVLNHKEKRERKGSEAFCFEYDAEWRDGKLVDEVADHVRRQLPVPTPIALRKRLLQSGDADRAWAEDLLAEHLQILFEYDPPDE